MAHAYYILIDESDAGLLVTYQALRAESGFVPRKTMAVLDRASQDELQRTAYARRIARR